MKIAFYSFPNLAHGGGFEKYIFLLSKELSNRGHDVSIVTIDRKLQYNLEVALSFFYASPRLDFPDKFRLTRDEIVEKIGKTTLHEMPSLWKMREQLNKADVVYSKNELLDLSILYMLRNKQTPPLICGLHSAVFYPATNSYHSRLHNSLYSSCLYGKLLSMFSLVHVVNPDQIVFLKNNFSNLNAPISHIPYWVDLPKGDLRFDPNSKFRVLFLGRLTEQKGVDVLIKVIRLLQNKPEFEDMVFNIAGSGELKNQVLHLCRIYDNVNFLGFVNPTQISEICRQNDVCIVPSKWETVSYVCLEAQISGLPVVCSKIAGPKHIVKHDETGFLVEATDVQGFGDALLKLYELKKNDFKRFQEFQRRGIENVACGFSKENVISRLEQMFETVSTQR